LLHVGYLRLHFYLGGILLDFDLLFDFIETNSRVKSPLCNRSFLSLPYITAPFTLSHDNIIRILSQCL